MMLTTTHLWIVDVPPDEAVHSDKPHVQPNDEVAHKEPAVYYGVVDPARKGRVDENGIDGLKRCRMRSSSIFSVG